MSTADALRVACAVAEEMVAGGATGVALLGSYARDEAHPHSDLDIVALGEGCSRLVVRDGLLVSQSWLRAADTEAIWRDVAYVGQTVPGWRHARPLLDPSGQVAALKRRADAWTWAELGDAPDLWIARELPGYAEEVLRLTGHVLAGRWWPATVMRNVCANRMAWMLGVHFRLLYETENRLWDLVGDRMGDAWRERQAAAFGLNAPFDESCRAAIDLFAMTADAVAGILDADGRSVVAAAVRAGRAVRED